MADEYEDEDTGYSDSVAPAQGLQLMLGNQYSSPEAHRLAKTLYESTNIDRIGIGEDEDEVQAQLEETARQAREALAQARQKLMQRKYDESEKWLAAAAAFGSPTATGGWGETFGKVAGSQIEPRRNKRAFEQQQITDDLALSGQESEIDRLLAESRMRTINARRAANAKLSAEALKTLSREIRPGAGGPGGKGPPSKYGKIAVDMGYEYGTENYFKKVEELQAEDARNASASAGTDAAVNTDPQAQLELAHYYAVPPQVIDPYAKMSTRQRDAAMRQDRANVDEKLTEMAAQAAEATEGITKIDRFIALNKKTDTGPVQGILPAITAAEQEMDAITAETSRKMRTPGEGSTSDYDAKMFKAGTVSRQKNRTANLNMGNAYKAMRQNEIDKVSFLQGYATVYGNLHGADAAWRQYLEANPIFDKTQPGKQKLNPKRQRYTEYFRAQMGDRPAVDGGEEVIIDEEVIDDPGRYPGDDTPAVMKAEGGRVSALRAFMEGDRVRVANKNLHGAGKKGRIHSTSDKSGFVVVKMDDGSHRSYHDSDLKKNEFYAEGGVVEGEEEEIDPEHLREMLYAALQGLTGGSADEIRAAAGDPEGAAQDRAEYSAYTDEHPAGRSAGLIAGVAPLAYLLGGPGRTLAQLMAAGAGSGATFGATGGDEDRGTDAVMGAVKGAIAGPAAGLTSKYLYNKVGQLVDSTRGMGLNSGEEKLVNTANRDKVDLGKIAQDLHTSDRLRVPEGVQDHAGRRTQGLIERAAVRGGDDSDIFVDNQDIKQDGSYSRVEDQMNRGMAPSEYFAEHDKLQHELYNNSKPLYDKAYKKYPGIKSTVFMELMNTKDGKKAIGEAFRLMELDGKPIGRANAAGIVQKPSLEFLDYVKRGLDQMITVEEKGGATPLGRAWRHKRNQLRDELDTAAPEYAAARQQYAGDLEVRDALVMGRSDFNKMAPEEVRRYINDASWAERDAFRSGVFQFMQDQLGRPSGDFNPAKRILGSDSMRAKLEASFDDPKKWKVFEAALSKEADMYDRTKSSQARVKGQRTAAAGKEESLLSRLDPGMANTPGMGGISLYNRVYNWLRFPLAMSEETSNQLIRAIDRGDIKQFDSTMQRLSQAQSRLARRGKRGSKVGALTAIAAGAMTQPTPPGDAAPDEAP